MALYITLKRHRNDIFVPNDQTSTDVETFNDETQLTSGCSSPASQSSERESFGFTVNDNDARSFSFLLDIYDWKKVIPLSSHRRRSSTSRFFHFKTLPKFKWSSILKEKIWIHSKLPCTWTLKKYRIRDDLFNILGKCSQCNAEVRISNSRKTEKFQEIHCKIHNFDKTFKHNPKKKSKLKHKQKTKTNSERSVS